MAMKRFPSAMALILFALLASYVRPGLGDVSSLAAKGRQTKAFARLLGEPKPDPYTFRVENRAGYNVQLTCQWYDPVTQEIMTYQSTSYSWGDSASKTFAETDLGIQCRANIVIAGFREIFKRKYRTASALVGAACTQFSVGGTLFAPYHSPVCDK